MAGEHASARRGMRPAGVAALEDRIVRKAVSGPLPKPIPEAEFLGFSNGFRLGRGAHDALATGIERRKTN